MTAVSHEHARVERKSFWRRAAGPILAAFALILAGVLLYRVFRQYALSDILASVRAASAANLALGFAFAGASYLCLTLFDWMATRYAGRPLPWRRAAHASFIALSLGHNIGFAALSSGAVRYRFYARWGLNAEQVAKIILFCGSTVGLGLAALIGLACLLQPDAASRIIGITPATARAIGVLCLCACAAWLLCAAFVRRQVRVRSWRFRFPPLRLAVGQLLIGPLNFALVAACLHQAMLTATQIDYASTVTAYVLGNAAALVSHVPGGLGVIESVIWLAPGAQIIGALVIFRVTYFFTPLVFGVVGFAVTEIWWRRRLRR